MVTVNDLMLCVRMIRGLPVTVGGTVYTVPYPADLAARADMNKDGAITVADLLQIFRAIP